MNNQLIGLSLSKCIADIITGKISSKDVGVIICGCRQSGWQEILESYARSYWRKDSKKAVNIAKKFMAQGKIEFPRDTNGRYPLIADGHWVSSREEIEWLGKES